MVRRPIVIDPTLVIAALLADMWFFLGKEPSDNLKFSSSTSYSYLIPKWTALPLVFWWNGENGKCNVFEQVWQLAGKSTTTRFFCYWVPWRNRGHGNELWVWAGMIQYPTSWCTNVRTMRYNFTLSYTFRVDKLCFTIIVIFEFLQFS